MIDASDAPNASNPDHIYRLPPSEAVDDAWDRISDIPMFALSREDIIKIQKDPDISVLAPEEWGFGNDEDGNPKYFMEPDVFHQIHCLNAIRKGLIHNYDYYWGQEWGFVPPVNFERHMNHVQCNSSSHFMCNPSTNSFIVHRHSPTNTHVSCRR